jgi:SAM-dependent methyltransferase
MVLSSFVLHFFRIMLLLGGSTIWVPTTSTRTTVEALSVGRRELLVWPIGAGGAIIYGKLVSQALQKLSRGDAYPDAHERRVESTLVLALTASLQPRHLTDGESFRRARPAQLRLLEVGMGTECRLVRRGLYASAIRDAALKGVRTIEVTGVDIATPSDKVLEDARRSLQRIGAEHDVQIEFQFIPRSITSTLDNVADGYYDCVISALTLCSVDDQIAALQEIKRLLRPDGGTFGFVEHVAVNPDEPYRFLELQQKLFDPLQQVVADNCHLHRYTETMIEQVFLGTDDGVSSKKLSGGRFLVEDMWPVSCQSSGVIQRIR